MKLFTDQDIKEKLDSFLKSFGNNVPSVPQLTDSELAGMIDHTILKPEALSEEIEKLCREALEYRFASVCVNSSYVELCASVLKGSDIKVCTVVGFPLGAMAGEIKVKETEYAVNRGAGEVDMVINIGRLKSKDYNFVYGDIKQVSDAAHKAGALCKVIIETCLLTDEEKTAVSLIVLYAGADYIKTSTGFSKAGADAKDVALMKFIGGNKLKVKASGGIRTAEDALIMIASGASRLGTSSGIKILEEYKKKNRQD